MRPRYETQHGTGSGPGGAPARTLASIAVLLLLAVPSTTERLGGQEPGDTLDAPSVTPGGAFLRSLALPGWGHAATGSYTRAGFYFVSSAGTLWMLLKTAYFLDAAEDRLELVTGEVDEELIRSGVTDDLTRADEVESDPRVVEIENLVEARNQQMEDWTSFGVFWLLLSAADAFVSAHLMDFPEPVELEIRPGSRPGRGELRLTLPLGGGRR